MRIPIPKTPRWLDRLIDWTNVDIGPELKFRFITKYQPRRLDLIMVIAVIAATIIDSMFFHPWSYALVMDPLIFIFGIMVVIWFLRIN